MMRAAQTEHAVLRTVGAIYDAAAAPDRWADTLEQLRDMFGLAVVTFVVSSADRAKVDGIAAGIDRDDYQAFLDTYFRGSVFLREMKGWSAGQIIRSTEVVPHAAFRRTRMYQDYWRPHDMHQGLRLVISIDGAGMYRSINLIRPPSGDPFDASDIALSRTLMPHLQRATELGQRLGHADLLASAALATLDVLQHPVLLLDQDCRMLHTNTAGDALLAAADGLSATHDFLYAATPSATSGFHAALARATGADGRHPQASSLRLPKRGGSAMLAVLVMPFRQEPHWSLSRQPAVLLCVTDPDAAPSVPGRLMMDLFGLTGAEAALATDLLAGRELRDIARARSRSINTVRTQLARLMAKTGVNRQSALIRLMAGLPRGTEPG